MAAFSFWDYFLFALSLGTSLGIGLWIAFRDRHDASTANYLFGHRQMPVLPSAISMVATAVSSLMILTFPGEIYAHGSAYLWWPLLFFLTSLVLAFVALPKLYSIKSSSMYAYLEDRFGSKTLRLYGSIIWSVSALMILGILQYSPAVAIIAVMPAPLWLVICIVGGVCIVYTVLGGLRGVVWADTLQAMVIVAGLIAMIYRGAVLTGGLSESLSIAREGHLFADFWNFADFSPFQRQSPLLIIVGGLFTQMSLMIPNQEMWQRYCSMPSLRQAQIGAILFGVLTAIVFLLVNLLSIIMFSYYAQTSNPLLDGRVDSKDQLVLVFMKEIFDGIPGLSGLFVAALLSATLSTVSSIVNSLSAVAHAEIVVPLSGGEDGGSRSVWLARLSSVVFGLVSIGLAFVVGPIGGAVQAFIGIIGTFKAPLLALIMMGILVDFIGAKPALIGAFCGTAVGLTIFGGYVSRQLKMAENFTQIPFAEDYTVSLFNVSPFCHGVIACLSTVIIASLLACCMRQKVALPTGIQDGESGEPAKEMKDSTDDVALKHISKY